MDQKSYPLVSSFSTMSSYFCRDLGALRPSLMVLTEKLWRFRAFRENTTNENAKAKRSQNYITVYPIMNLWSHRLLWPLLLPPNHTSSCFLCREWFHRPPPAEVTSMGVTHSLTTTLKPYPTSPLSSARAILSSPAPPLPPFFRAPPLLWFKNRLLQMQLNVIIVYLCCLWSTVVLSVQ